MAVAALVLAANLFSTTPAAAQCGDPDCEIPPAADEILGIQDPDNGLLISDLGGGLFVASELASQVYQAMFLVHSHGVIMVDAPPTLMDTANGAPFLVTNLLGAIDDISGGKPVTHLIYSHIHRDHIGGAGAVKAAFPRVKIIAHAKVRRRLLEIGDPDRPAPSEGFRNDRTVAAGGQVLRLSYHGDFHDRGDIFIFAPKQRTLMVIDVVFPQWVPFANLAVTKDVGEFIAVHDEILEFDGDVDHFVGGHLTRIGDMDDVRRAQAYIAAVRNAAGQALFELAVKDPANPFDGFPIEYFVFGPSPFNVFSHFLDDVDDRCEELVLSGEASDPPGDDFSDLGGVTVFTKSHCFPMQIYVRVEE